jgi:hypothetical protein
MLRRWASAPTASPAKRATWPLHLFPGTPFARRATAYVKNGGTLESAAQMANHASTPTTHLYDRCAEGSDARRD